MSEEEGESPSPSRENPLSRATIKREVNHGKTLS